MSQCYKYKVLKLTSLVDPYQDWFDDNDPAISDLLDNMHKAHHTWLQDKGSTSKATAYRKAKQLVQAKTRAMKDSWWSRKAQELQQAAEQT